MYIRDISSLAAKLIWLCLVTISTSSSIDVWKNAKPVEEPFLRIEKYFLINGQPTTIQDFPFVVQILNQYEKTKFRCGGTVVSARHIVTAAHCLYELNTIDLKVVAKATFVNDFTKLGKFYKFGIEQTIVRFVEAFYRHPNYTDSNPYDNDVAVLKLKEALPLGNGVRAVPMCKKPWKANDEITILGWGKTSVDGAEKYSNQLQTVKLRGISRKTCQQQASKGTKITSQMSCTSVINGKDACHGDSGGPAMLDGALCGVISFGFSCGIDGYPGVYTKIPSVRQFIWDSLKK